MPAKYDKPVSPLLLTDFYKICHKSFYHPDTQKLISYWTPRKSRVEGIDEIVMFGLQAYIKKYLIDYFNVYFFETVWSEIEEEYLEVIGESLDRGIAEKEISAFKELHELGYLPIEIRALPEGTLVPVGCPMIEFKCTDDRFFWLVNYLETLSSCNIWYPMTTATIAYTSRMIVNRWYSQTVDDDVPRSTAAGDFSMRGMSSTESAALADGGHLLSFSSTATVPAICWLHNFYQAPYSVAKGTPSTEHSVMESYLPQGEFEAYRHLIEDVMPGGVLSMVSDTWDLWRVITEYLPQLKQSILNRDGKIVIRPDSGDPVDILCGTKSKEDGADDRRSPAEKGVVELLWEIFGGSVNQKGYKVLDSHIGTIYGDAITHERADAIFRRLAEKGFASNNVILGFGSYTYQYVTRDTFGFALKVTSGVVAGREVAMFKEPVTDQGKNGACKKSQKGMCIVTMGESGRLCYTDGHTEKETVESVHNLLQPVFRDGALLRDEDFSTIRRRLHSDF